MSKPEIARTLAATDFILYRDGGKASEFEIFTKYGSGTLPSGVNNVVVSDAAVKTTSKILVTPTATLSGQIFVNTIVNGVSFKVNSTATDGTAVTFNYVIAN